MKALFRLQLVHIFDIVGSKLYLFSISLILLFKQRVSTHHIIIVGRALRAGRE